MTFDRALIWIRNGAGKWMLEGSDSQFQDDMPATPSTIVTILSLSLSTIKHEEWGKRRKGISKEAGFDLVAYS